MLKEQMVKEILGEQEASFNPEFLKERLGTIGFILNAYSETIDQVGLQGSSFSDEEVVSLLKDLSTKVSVIKDSIKE